MYTGKDFTFNILWHFARKNLFRTFLVSTAACVLYSVYNLHFIAIPFLPIGTIGTAVAFFIGFKNNQAYDRLWEARKIWGGLVNVSRNLAAQSIALIEDSEIRNEILYRHIAYVNILRMQLRKTIPWATSKDNLHQTFQGEREELEAFDLGLKRLLEKHNKSQYYEILNSKSNAAAFLLKIQIGELTKLKRGKKIDDFEHSDLVKFINECYNLQGAAERIKSTPLFRQYSIFSRVFVLIFIFLLPFGLLESLSSLANWAVWLTVPFSMLISWVFFTMEQIGEFSENPFDNSLNDIPISAICNTIERDVLELMGIADLPPKSEPTENVLL